MNEWPFIAITNDFSRAERLQGLFLPKLFADMSRDCATGMLWLRSGDTTTGIHWRSGEIVFALSSSELFSASLLEQRLLTSEQVKTLESFCRANGTDVYDALISLGYFNRGDLFPVLKAHVYIVSYSCLDWADGVYFFEQALPSIPYELLTSVQVSELVLESTQNLFSIERLREFLGSCEQARFIPSDAVLLGDSYKYKEQAALIEQLVSSINRYSELKQQVESEEDLIRILSGLVALGAITIEQVEPLPVLEEIKAPVEAEEYAPVEASDIGMFFYEIENMLGHLKRPGTDYYSMLEVARQASAEEIETAYRRLARKFSRDRCKLSMPIIEERLDEIQTRLSEAFSVLRDQVKRAVYTQTLNRSGSFPGMAEEPAPVVEQKVAAPKSEKQVASEPVKPAIDVSKLRNPDDWYLLGLELLERGDNDRAVKVFQNAIKMRPSDSEFHAGLARACDAAYGYNEQTVKMFEKAIGLNPSSEADYQAELGVFYLKHGRLEQAEMRLSKSLAIDPDHRVATKAIARLQQKKG